MTNSSNNKIFSRDPMDIFDEGGQMGELMERYDWKSHPLGPPQHWQGALKTAIRIMLKSSYPMFVWWSRELYMFHNDAYLPALGVKHPEALGSSARDMWEEIWEQIGDIVESILQGGPPFYAEELRMLLDRKGFLEETYWTFSYSASPDDNGGVGGIFCACNETTKTVLGQRRLNTIKDLADLTGSVTTEMEAGKKVSRALSKNPFCITFSLVYLLDSFNKAADLLCQTGALKEEDAPAIVEIQNEGSERWPFSQVLLTKKMAIVEHTADSNITGGFWSEHTQRSAVFPMFKPGQDELIGFFVSGISPRLEYDLDYQNFQELLAGQIAASISGVQVREEAERQQQDLIYLFEQAPVSIAILRGEELKVELANPKMCELWGRTYQEVIDRQVFEALPEAKDQGLEELLHGVLRTGLPHSANEFPVMLNRIGKPQKTYVNLVYNPFRDARGAITGITAVAVDVTEQVKARHEIEAKNMELLTINADLDNFVYSASHDLKAPISNIEGLMHALVRYLPQEVLSSEKVSRLIELIQASIERFKKTVLDLTEITKLQRETGEDVSLINLAEVITEVKLDLDSMIAESDAQINTYFFNCPPIRFSAKNVRSIVYNLMSNALKYRSPERRPELIITTNTTRDYIVLSFADNGLGMAPADQSKIFSMFKRLHDHVEGSGIGLYIVKKIVENAGGKIEVESKINEGTTFKVYFQR